MDGRELQVADRRKVSAVEVEVHKTTQPKNMPVYGVVEPGAARLMRIRTSLELLSEKAGGVHFSD